MRLSDPTIIGYLKVVREGVLLGVGVGVLGRVRKGMGLYVTGSLVGFVSGVWEAAGCVCVLVRDGVAIIVGLQ